MSDYSDPRDTRPPRSTPDTRGPRRLPDDRARRSPDEGSRRAPDEGSRRSPDEGPRRSPDEGPRRRRTTDPRRIVLLVVAAVIVVGAIIFWAQNHGRVSISYLTVNITAPLWFMVTGYFLVGILIGALLTVYYQRRQP